MFSDNDFSSGPDQLSAKPRPDVDDQTAADRDQTASDHDQTASDSDQTASDRDQTASGSDAHSSDLDQQAADREQDAADHGSVTNGKADFQARNRAAREAAAHDRRVTAEFREGTAAERLGTARERDSTANARDETADLRDNVASVRDRDALEHDSKVAHRVPYDIPSLQAQAAEDRASAAADRERAAEDRKRAARDRAEAVRQRTESARARAAAAHDLELAATDPLTGTRARGVGLADLQHEIDRARRTKKSLVIAFVDVDHLKEVNDHEGHLAGDRLLSEVADALRHGLRSYDLIMRFGGDEFICALSAVSLNEAKLRFDWLSKELGVRTGGRSVTVGFAELDDDDDLIRLIARADAALLELRRAR